MSDNSRCSAYGCPLPGSLSRQRGPGIPYYCRFHFNANVKDFDAISTRIRQHFDLAMQSLMSRSQQQESELRRLILNPDQQKMREAA